MFDYILKNIANTINNKSGNIPYTLKENQKNMNLEKPLKIENKDSKLGIKSNNYFKELFIH